MKPALDEYRDALLAFDAERNFLTTRRLIVAHERYARLVKLPEHKIIEVGRKIKESLLAA